MSSIFLWSYFFLVLFWELKKLHLLFFLVLFRFRVTSLFSPVYFAFIQAVKQHASSLNVTWHCPYPHNCQYAPSMYCRLYCNWPVYAVKWSGANPWALFSDSFAPLWISILSKIHFLEYHLIARWHHMYVKKHFFLEIRKKNLRWRVSGPGAWQQRWTGLRPPSHSCNKV